MTNTVRTTLYVQSSTTGHPPPPRGSSSLLWCKSHTAMRKLRRSEASTEQQKKQRHLMLVSPWWKACTGKTAIVWRSKVVEIWSPRVFSMHWRSCPRKAKSMGGRFRRSVIHSSWSRYAFVAGREGYPARTVIKRSLEEEEHAWL